MTWEDSSRQTDNGNIFFSYTQLGELKNKLEPDALPSPELLKKAKVVSITAEYESGIIPLFHATGNFNYRNRWQDGVLTVEGASHFLPRVGMGCRLLKKNEVIDTYASSYQYTPEKISFSETNEKQQTVTCYTLEKKTDRLTTLTVDYYIEKNPMSQIIFKLLHKQKIRDSFNASLQKLHGFVNEINRNFR